MCIALCLVQAPHTQRLPVFVASSHGNLLVPVCQRELNLACHLTAALLSGFDCIWFRSERKKVTPTDSV